MAEAHSDPRSAIARFVEHAYDALDTASYYQILGVGPDASHAQLRTTYYQLAARLHPDLHAEWPPEVMRKLTAVYSRVVEAYKILTHGERREQYDRGLAEGRIRWDADAAARPKIKRVEDEIPDGAARKFFMLGRDALVARNGKAAVMNLRMALSMAPRSQTIKDELARAEELEKSQGGG